MAKLLHWLSHRFGWVAGDPHEYWEERPGEADRLILCKLCRTCGFKSHKKVVYVLGEKHLEGFK